MSYCRALYSVRSKGPNSTSAKGPIPMKDASIGERIRELRGSTLSQRRLAERAEVSVDLIRKLEQGSRTGASIASLHKIARALDVDIADLLGKRHGLPSPDPDAGVVAIRRALTTVDDLLDSVAGQEPVSLLEATRAVEYAWGAYWSGRYGVLASILPSGIAQLRAAAHAAQSQDIAPVNEQLARMMWVTGCTLVHFGQTDPAFIAIREALQAAERGNDPLLAATLRGSVGWQLLVQGRFEEARGVALKAAATVEPAGDVPPAHLSVYGALLLQGATAAGRNQHTGEAISLAREARRPPPVSAGIARTMKPTSGQAKSSCKRWISTYRPRSTRRQSKSRRPCPTTAPV